MIWFPTPMCIFNLITAVFILSFSFRIYPSSLYRISQSHGGVYLSKLSRAVTELSTQAVAFVKCAWALLDYRAPSLDSQVLINLKLSHECTNRVYFAAVSCSVVPALLFIVCASWLRSRISHSSQGSCQASFFYHPNSFQLFTFFF